MAGVEKRRKKKGRPSLLDLQKRSLKQQQLQNQNTNHYHKRSNPNRDPKHNDGSSNPYLRFTNSTHGTTRNPIPEEEDEEEEEGGKKREKKLKLVLKLPHNGRQPATEGVGLDSSMSEEDEEGSGVRMRLKKRRIDTFDAAGSAAGGERTERHSSLMKAEADVELPNSELTTPLPDEKLLLFILDRLQKKDTYGVFSEPVDPNELPDYHDIIEHPMDFSTIRQKLANGEYANLEQFEEDVFLISSNAMRYNSPDTIYFRQARSIHELAKKDFNNLRQESDDGEPEPKNVRRGRPPSKNTIKKSAVRALFERSSSSHASGTNASFKECMSNLSTDIPRKGSISDRLGIVDSSARVPSCRNSESNSWMGEKKSEITEEHSGSVLKGLSTRYGKKVTYSVENRRNTYKQALSNPGGHEPSILTTFDGERRELLPVGLYMEHSFARSLARFASNLGQDGWKIAARQIESVLPTGMKFGRGYVGEQDAPQQEQPPLLSTSISPQPVIVQSPSKSDNASGRLESSCNVSAAGSNQSFPSPSASSAVTISNKKYDTAEVVESPKTPIGKFYTPSSGIKAKSPFQHQSSVVQPTVNGFNTGFAHDLPQLGQMERTLRPSGGLSSDTMTTHVQALDMVSRNNNSFVPVISSGQFNVQRSNVCGTSMENHEGSLLHQTKFGGSSAMTSINSFIHSTATHPLETQVRKLNNPNTMDTSNSKFVHPAAGQEIERGRLRIPKTVDSENRISHNLEATRQTQSQRAALGNSSTINPVTSFTHPVGTDTDKGHSEPDKTKLGGPSTITAGSPMPELTQSCQGFWRNLSLNPRPDSAPPDLNVRFQSPGSPASKVAVDSQQPDLALQL